MNDFNEGEDFKKVGKVVTQVATLVRPQMVIPKSCELKLGRNRPHRLMGRFSDGERTLVMGKAKAAMLSVNEFIRAVTLGSDYKPPTDPELTQTLLKLNRELTAQGNNLNQIAYHLNSGKSSLAEGTSLLAIISRSMLQTHKAIRTALSWGKAPEP